MDVALSPAPSKKPPPFRSTPPAIPLDEGLGRGLKISIGFHIGIALLVLVQGLFFPGNPVMNIPSLRVDLVGLPDQLKQPAIKPPAHGTSTQTEEAKPTPPTPPAPKTIKAPEPVEEAKPDEMLMKPKQKAVEKSRARAEKKRAEKLENALARIRALSKISDPTKAPDPNEADDDAPIKGNKVSLGTSTSANAQESDKANYIDSIQSALQQNWALPIWIERQKLNAKVLVFIDSTGVMTHFKFVQSSGNSQFDEAVKRTLAETSPFPVPPSDIAPSLASSGVLVGFPL